MMNKQKLINLKQRLEAYYKAEQAILTSQAYTVGSNTLTRANLREVQQSIRQLENEIAFLEAGAIRKVMRVVPTDGI